MAKVLPHKILSFEEIELQLKEVEGAKLKLEAELSTLGKNIHESRNNLNGEEKKKLLGLIANLRERIKKLDREVILLYNAMG